MSLVLSRALCFHAAAGDLTFLNPVRNRVSKMLGDKCTTFHFQTQHDQADAKLRLKQSNQAFVIIMAHGGSSYILGGEQRRRSTGDIVQAEHFLTKDELSYFSGKIIYCMSCDSNSLAQAAINAGAIAFVGFDLIPFERFDTAGNPIRHPDISHHTQILIADATKATLEHFITGQASLDDSIEYLKLWSDFQAVNFVRKMRSIRERKEIAALFLKMKNGVKYHGQRGVQFSAH